QGTDLPSTIFDAQTSEILVRPARTPLPFRSRSPRFTSYFVYSSLSIALLVSHLRANSSISGVISKKMLSISFAMCVPPSLLNSHFLRYDLFIILKKENLY